MKQAEILALRNMTWLEAKESLAEVRFALLPIGAIEQHGPHLPVDTDAIIAEYLGCRVAKALRGLLLPVMSYGASWSLRQFPGTISLSPQTIVSFICDVSDSLYRHGLTWLMVLNCHLGNAASLKEAERSLRDRPGGRIAILNLPGLEKASEDVCTTPRWHPAYLHSCEVETSIMLAIDPRSCHMERAVREYPEVPPYLSAVSVPWDQITNTGVIGDATVATAEKGRYIVEKVLAASCDVILRLLDDVEEGKYEP